MVRVDRASAIVCYRQSVREGFKVRVRQLFVDVLVGNYEGDFVIVRKQVAFDEAEAFQRDWLMNERDAVCILWPSETLMPTEWRLVNPVDGSAQVLEEPHKA
ncbi:MAG: hypothetical protein MUC43_08005 [Pirellula sp.]|nr:hypothetical protein [Pirellula sp.]